MSGDFCILQQGSLPITTGSAVSYTIPTNITGFPTGQALVVKVVADTKAVVKVGGTGTVAVKTLSSNNLAAGNFYAYKGAIETYKVSSLSATVTPTIISAIADSADGNIDYAFGYYL